jgi:hypothetical protein
VHVLGAAVWTEDYLADERFAHTPAVDAVVRDEGLRGVVVVPLRSTAPIAGPAATRRPSSACSPRSPTWPPSPRRRPVCSTRPAPRSPSSNGTAPAPAPRSPACATSARRTAAS